GGELPRPASRHVQTAVQRALLRQRAARGASIVTPLRRRVTADKTQMDADKIDEEILACEAKLRHAQLTSDVAALDRLLDDVLVFTSIDGTLASKSDDLSLHRSGRLRITRMDPSDRQLLHLGATSVVSVRMNAEAVMDGVPVAGTLRYTRIW